MAINMNPKFKLALGLGMVGGSAWEFYNASKATGAKRILHLIAGGGLLTMGLLTSKKGYAEVRSGKVGATPTTDGKKPSLAQTFAKEFMKPTEKDGKKKEFVQDHARPQNTNTIVAEQTLQANGKQPKVVGQVDKRTLAQQQERKSRIQKRIGEL